MSDATVLTTAPAAPRPAARIFVVHARADEAWVLGYLLPALDRFGAEVATEAQFEAGRPWRDQVIEAVDEADRVVLVLSRAFVADHKLRWIELIAEHRGLSEAAYLLLPIRLEEVDLGPALEALVLLDATDPERRAGVVDMLCRDLAGVPRRPAPAAPDCPYPGLAAYTEDDGALFFGREAEVRSTADCVARQRRVVLMGPSGSGKSSLVLAGVLPLLRSRGWRAAVMRPGAHPVAALDVALRSLADAPDERQLLVVDQLEEVFTVEDGERSAFAAALLEECRSGRAAMALTARADFLGRFMESPQLWSLVGDHRVEVLPLSGDDLAAAVTGPAAAVGVHVDPVLVERLVTDATDEPGRLPLLQETLRLIWADLELRYLPLRAYTALVDGEGPEARHGLQVALARHADATWKHVDDADRDVARRVLVRLVQFGDGGPDARRQVAASELYDGDDDRTAVERVVGRLAAARLLIVGSTESATGEVVVDLAHEALIRHWPTFARWLQEHRAAEHVRRELERHATRWIERGRGGGGLLDEAELAEAERWLSGPDPAQVGAGDDIRALVAASRASIEQRHAEEARRRTEQLDLQRRLAMHSARSARRFRLLTGVLAVLLVAALGAGTAAVVQQRRAVEQRTQAWAAELARAAALQPDELVDRAMVLAASGDALHRSRATRAGLLAALTANPRVVREVHLGAAIQAFAASADGRLVAAGTEDGRVTVVDVQEGRPQTVLRLASGQPRSIAFSPDGARIAVGANDATVGIWDVTTGSRDGRALDGHTGSVRAVAFSPDGRRLATAGTDAVILVHRLDGSGPARRLVGHTDWVNTLAFSPDGATLVSGSGATEERSTDSRVLAWPLAGEDGPVVVGAHADAVRAVAFSPDGRLVATAGADDEVRIWDVAAHREVARLQGHTRRVFSVAFTPDGRHLLSGGRDRVVRVWDVASGKPVGEPLRGHELAVRGVAAISAGEAVSAGTDGRLVVWDISADPGQRLVTPVPDAGDLTDAAVTPDGRTIVSATADGHLVTRDARTGETLAPPLPVGTPVQAMTFAPDGALVVAVAGRLEAWRPLEGRRVAGPVDVGGAVTSLAVAGDGSIAAGGRDATIRVWHEGLAGQPLRFDGHASWVTGLAFPSGGGLVSVGADGRVFAWPLDGSGDPQTATEIAGQYTAAAASPVAGVVLAGDTDGRLHVLAVDHDADDADDRSLRVEQVVLAHASTVTAIDVGADGRAVVSTDDDGALALWALDAGVLRPVGPQRQAGAGVRAAAFTDGVSGLVTAGPAGMLLWDNDPRAWRHEICSVAGRSLTEDERHEFAPALDEVDPCPAPGG